MHSLQLLLAVFLVVGAVVSAYPVDWDEGSTTESPTSSEENTWKGRFDFRPVRGPSKSVCRSCKQLFSLVALSSKSSEEEPISQQAIETASQQSQELQIKEVCKEMGHFDRLFKLVEGRNRHFDPECPCKAFGLCE
ncbi:hypothetical protein M3Y99_01233200 [Aphelenchoides fujianensis]|nr:hypothetical protein M3Y99_01233200 [Aphelenchoides fujianensis]